MPFQLEQWIRELPGISANNSKAIVRQAWERVKNKSPYMQATILNAKFGLGLDPDYIEGFDDGCGPRYENYE